MDADWRFPSGTEVDAEFAHRGAIGATLLRAVMTQADEIDQGPAP